LGLLDSLDELGGIVARPIYSFDKSEGMGQISVNQTKTAGKGDRLSAAFHPQLGIDVVEMELHGSF
jgi:hypothetical protein